MVQQDYVHNSLWLNQNPHANGNGSNSKDSPNGLFKPQITNENADPPPASASTVYTPTPAQQLVLGANASRNRYANRAENPQERESLWHSSPLGFTIMSNVYTPDGLDTSKSVCVFNDDILGAKSTIDLLNV
jgi:hypothetical protein